MDNLNRGAWLQTYTGKQFFVSDPHPDDVNIEDIAHALAYSSRFNGHTKEFYSIAQHCYLVSKVCPKEEALWGLLHDAGEAYLGDVIQPVKRYLKAFVELEWEVERAIAAKFGLEMPIPRGVKRADLELLATEARDLMLYPHPANWDLGVAPLADIYITPWAPQVAERMYLERFRELTGSISG